MMLRAPLTALTLLAALALTAVPASAINRPATVNVAPSHQSTTGGLDTATANTWGWSNTVPGVAGRPYIKSFTVTNGNNPPVNVVNADAGAGNGWAPTSATTAGGISDVYAFIHPTNGCKVGQPPTDGVCYATPNRVTVQLAHYEGAGNGWSPDFTGATTDPQISANSVVEIVIGFKPTYSSLRWSWVNGVPSSWSSTVNAFSGGEVRLKFTPATMPDTTGLPNQCSTIPVSSCGDNSTRPNGELLSPQVILSMDTTLNPIFAGTLFGTTNAVIGSLDASPITAGEIPQLTYGIAAPHLNADGTDRVGALYAVIPSAILTLFNTSSASFDQSLIPISRSGDPGSFTPSWTRWTTGANGMDAMRLDITGITFSSPKFIVGRQSSGGGSGGSGGGTGGGGGGAGQPAGGSSGTEPGRGGNGNRVKVGSMTSLASIVKTLSVKTSAGSKTTAKVSTPKVCSVVGGKVRAIAVGTCKGTLTITPKKGTKTTKRFSLVVTK